MSRLTMERNGSLQNGPSRIPRLDPGNRSTISSNTFSNQQPLPNVGASKGPSRLEQMQFEYQKNILKYKEDKLINMHEHSQKTALTKVNQNRGVVREFFNERKTHSGNNNNSMSPTIEHLYQQKISDNQGGQLESAGYRGNGRPMMNNSVSKYPNYNRGILRETRPSAGRDRANPLAPIQHTNGESENPFTRRKAQLVRPRTYKDVQNRNYPENVQIPKSAPNGFHNDYNDDESPLPDAKQLQHLQQKRKLLQSQRQSNQMRAAQQNGASTSQAPASRRNPQYEYETSEEDEGYGETETGSNSTEGDMKKKQNELLAQIAAQQRELDKLRNERLNAEIGEKKEIERRRKLEDERKKRMVEEEKRKQKEEEAERMKHQWEEEKQEKIEKEKRRMRQVSQNSHASENEKRSNSYNNRYNETRHSPSPPPQSYYEKQPSPTPPPQPRPANTRKVMPKKQAPKTKPASPLPSGDHTALYDNADQIEGAFENVGRLKQCYNCGRSFAEDRLGKHEQACKNITKKRKVLDTEKLRTKGTDMEQFVAHRQPTPPQLKKKNNWRTQHDNFMQAIRYAKKVTQIEKEGGNIADLPPPPPTENPDYVQCPHCTRKFNATAAERHIPHCKNSRAKPPPQRRR